MSEVSQPSASPPGDEPRVGRFLESAAAETIAQNDFLEQLQRETAHVRVMPCLVGLNAVAFVIAALAGANVLNPGSEALVRCGANFPPLTTAGEWWRLVSAMFLHVGILHLAVNVYALWGIGAITERLLGRRGMTTLYLLSGVGGNVASIAFQPFVVSAGASGAIFGLMGGILGLVIARRSQIPGELLRGLWSQVLVFLGVNLYLGFRIQGIDLYAHGGGFICGTLIGWLLAVAPVPGTWLPNARRIALVGTVMSMALAMATAFVPQPPDIDAVLRQFVSVEHELVSRQTTLFKKVQQGTISEAEFLAALKDDLLPQWVAARSALQVDQVPSAEVGELMAAVTAYAGARIDFLKILTTADAEQVSQLAEKLRIQGEKVSAALDEVNRVFAPEPEKR